MEEILINYREAEEGEGISEKLSHIEQVFKIATLSKPTVQALIEKIKEQDKTIQNYKLAMKIAQK